MIFHVCSFAQFCIHKSNTTNVINVSRKVNEAVRIKETEIRSLSKMILREQEAHEKSILLLRRRRVEERMLRSQLAQLEAQIEALQIQLSNLTKVKQTVEADLLRANNTLFKKQKEVAGPRRALEKLMREKVSLEDKILDILHEQSGLDKAAAHIRTLIRETRDKTRFGIYLTFLTRNEFSEFLLYLETWRRRWPGLRMKTAC